MSEKFKNVGNNIRKQKIFKINIINLLIVVSDYIFIYILIQLNYN